MSTSTAMIDPTQIPLSPMRVKFLGNDLGGTEGGVTVTVKFDTADIMVDQFGKTVINKKVSGQAFGVKFTLSEIKNKDKIKAIFPSAHEIVSGGQKMTYFDMQIGDDMLAHSGQMILHPLEAADADLSEDWMFYKAVCTQSSEVKYGPDKQSGLAVEFIIFPDTAASPARFLIYGDPTIGIVSAAAGTPTAAGGNTGNGTISSVVVYNTATKTETITALAVGTGSASANVFEISGSSSGVLSVVNLAHTGSSTVNVSTPVIGFTITQGSTAFALNDSITIATTASNYA